MLLTPRFRRAGFIGFGQILLVDVADSVVWVSGHVLIPLLWLLDTLNTAYFAALIAMMFTFGVFVSVATLILEEAELRRFARASDLAILTAVAVLEAFGYRQLANSGGSVAGGSPWAAIKDGDR